MRLLLSRPRDWKIGTKLTISYLGLSIALATVSYLTVAQLFFDLASEEAQINVGLIVDRVELELSSMIRRVVSTAEAISISDSVVSATGTSFMREAEQAVANSAILETFPKTIGADSVLKRIAIIGQNGLVATTSGSELAPTEPVRGYWYREILQSSFPPVLYAPRVESLFFAHTEEPVVSLGVPILDPRTGARIGVVVVEFAENRIRELLDDRLGASGYVFVQYQRTGFTLPRDIRPDTDYLSQLAATDSVDDGQLNRNREMVFTKDLPFPGMKLGAVISLDRLYEDTGIMLRRGLLVMIGGALIAAIAAFALSRTVVKPITILRDSMATVESGDLSVRIGSTKSDELGQLSSSFDSMVERIEILVKNVRDDQIQIREEQLNRMQEQINPHFLYNTLDTISWMAREGRVEAIPALVSSLTTVFRVGLSRGHEVIPVRDEIAHVESYLRIQAVRYGENLRYRIDFPDDALDCVTPKVVLQPLVENALYHGLRERPGTGLIEVSGRNCNGSLEMEVRDNGIGMAPERLALVQSELVDHEGTGSATFGLRNVHDRINMTFGTPFGLRVHSVHGDGTTITIRIPSQWREHV